MLNLILLANVQLDEVSKICFSIVASAVVVILFMAASLFSKKLVSGSDKWIKLDEYCKGAELVLTAIAIMGVIFIDLIFEIREPENGIVFYKSLVSFLVLSIPFYLFLMVDQRYLIMNSDCGNNNSVKGNSNKDAQSGLNEFFRRESKRITRRSNLIGFCFLAYSLLIDKIC